jgi:hypothetical protein
LQSNFAICVLTSAMHVLKNVKSTMWTTAKDVPRHVAAALKNVEGWLGNRATPIFLFYWNYY